jgi:hypothetical protein
MIREQQGNFIQDGSRYRWELRLRDRKSTKDRHMKGNLDVRRGPKLDDARYRVVVSSGCGSGVWRFVKDGRGQVW